jgi:hypothetical protein
MTWKSRFLAVKPKKKPETPKLIEETMSRLETWCGAQPGRKSEVARALLLHPSQVSIWISRGGTPRLKKFCELIDFLDEQIPPQNKTQ